MTSKSGLLPENIPFAAGADSPLEEEVIAVTPKKQVTSTMNQPKPPISKPDDYAPPSGGKTADVKGDLSEMFSFGSKNTTNMMRTQELTFDTTAQRPMNENIQDREDEVERRTRKQEKKQRGVKNVDQYDPLYVSQGSEFTYSRIHSNPRS